MSASSPVSAAAPLRVAIAGASGRMGRMLVEAVLDAPDCALAGALDTAASPLLGQDAGAYLGRTYEETKRRPKFIVDESLGFEGTE